MSIETVLSIFSVLASIAAVVITLYVYRNSRELGVKPVLVFLRRSSHEWELANVGTGPALEIMVGEMQWDAKEWSRFTNCYPIPADHRIDTPWLNAVALGVQYADIDGRKYTTVCRYDRNDVKRGHLFAATWPKLQDDRVVNEYERRKGH
jgi:hypothetical protein